MWYGRRDSGCLGAFDRLRLPPADAPGERHDRRAQGDDDKEGRAEPHQLRSEPDGRGTDEAGRMLVAQLEARSRGAWSPYRPGSSSAARPHVQGPPRSLTGVFGTIFSAIMAASGTYEEEHR